MTRTLAFILLSVCFFSVSAQTDSTGEGTTIDNVDIITIYKPDVAESVKIDVEPKLIEPEQPPITYNYSFPQVSFQPKAVYGPIDPIYLKPEKLEDLYDNYFELAGGNYATSYVDARVHNTHDKYYTYGLRVNHHASSASKNPQQGLFSKNRVTAFGKREKGSTLSGLIDYQRNVVHYYGYEDSNELSLNDINQIYNDVEAKAMWEKSGSFGTTEMELGFNLFSRLNGNENSIFLNNSNQFRIAQSTLHLDLKGLYNSINRDVVYQRFFFDISPHVAFRYKKYDLDLGVNLTYFNDSNTNRIYYAPFLKAQTYLVPDKLRAYVGIVGGLQRNTMRSMTYENRFLGNDAEFKNPFEKLHMYAGMNGKFKRFVEYGIRLSQRIVDDQYFFVNDTNVYRNLTTVYDSMGVFSFSGELKLDINQNLDIGFAGTVYSYKLNKLKDAWNLPKYDAKAFATVRIVDKIYVSAAYYVISPRASYSLDGNSENLRAIHDLNISGEYRYKKNISAFLNIQNLLNQRYPMWNHYNMQGLNVLAGVSFSL